MSRASARVARELREQWAAELASRPVPQTNARASVPGRGADYAGAPDEWACHRKKAYTDEETASRIAARLTEINTTGQGRPEFVGVAVNAYSCGRCGRWHIGR